MVLDIIRSDELRAKSCKTIYILEAIIFKIESKMAEVPLTVNAQNWLAYIDFDVSYKNA